AFQEQGGAAGRARQPVVVTGRHGRRSGHAWAAAVSPALVTAILGLDIDVPAGRLAVSPLRGFGPLSVSNVRVGAATVSIDVDPQGAVSLIGVPPDLTLDL
ncbi:hypothetical protein, partial [Actinoallomurus sp. NPDC052274]|uniref:hypothetical protein n=1 Tax=Actinoallomurus sp. NPDC052274 TaxID=3155420 RepID=UPI0034325088